MNGGYFMVDAKGVNMSAAEASKVDGLYTAVYTAMDSGKPVMLNNVLNGSDGLYTPIFVACSLSGTTITVHTPHKSFTIANDDTVTILS